MKKPKKTKIWIVALQILLIEILPILAFILIGFVLSLTPAGNSNIRASIDANFAIGWIALYGYAFVYLLLFAYLVWKRNYFLIIVAIILSILTPIAWFTYLLMILSH